MNEHQRTWKQTISYLAAWVFSTLVTVVDLRLSGAAVVQATIWFGAHRSSGSRLHDLLTGASFGWTVEFVGQVTLLLWVCIGLGLAIWLEYYYREGTERGQLVRRVVRVTITQAAVLAASIAFLVLTRIV